MGEHVVTPAADDQVTLARQARWQDMDIGLADSKAPAAGTASASCSSEDMTATVNGSSNLGISVSSHMSQRIEKRHLKQYNASALEAAIRAVIEANRSINESARSYGIPATTLKRRIRTMKHAPPGSFVHSLRDLQMYGSKGSTVAASDVFPGQDRLRGIFKDDAYEDNAAAHASDREVDFPDTAVTPLSSTTSASPPPTISCQNARLSSGQQQLPALTADSLRPLFVESSGQILVDSESHETDEHLGGGDFRRYAGAATCGGRHDSDELFLLSLKESMHCLTSRSKERVKLRMLQLLYEARFPEECSADVSEHSACTHKSNGCR